MKTKATATSGVITLDPVFDAASGELIYQAVSPTRSGVGALQVVGGELAIPNSSSAEPGPSVTLTSDRFAGTVDWAGAERAQDSGQVVSIVNGELVVGSSKPAESGQSVTLTGDRFAGRSRSVSRVRGIGERGRIERAPGTAWAITDLALQTLDRELAAPVPERGAALIGGSGSRLIIGAVIDPRPGEAVSYWHSDQLREDLAGYLSDHPAQRYVGTVHSHPGGYAEPSGPDLQAFGSTLESNPEIREAIFPIVVGAPRSALPAVMARFGQDHLVDLEHGTLAGYSAHPGPGGLVVRPAPMHVVPVAEHTAVAGAALTDRLGMPVEVRWGPTMTIGASGWVTAYFDVDGHPLAGVALSQSYPLTPPMLWRVDDSAPAFPGWPASASGADLAEALGALFDSARPEPGDRADEVRAGIRERLSVHLPAPVEQRVLIVGAGSVGSNAAELLVRSGVRALTIVDFDTVEPANLSRTVYTGADLGQPKTAALARRLTEIAPDLDLTVLDTSLQELTGQDFDRVDLAFLASDDLAGEGWLNHQLYSRSIPVVSVKLFAGAEGAELAYVDPARNTACLRCMMGSLGSADRGEVDYGTGRIQGSPALGPDIVAAAARGVKVALALTQSQGPLCDWLDTLAAQRRTYFLSSNVAGWKYTEFARPGSLPFDGIWLTAPGSPDCEICGPERTPAPQRPGVAEFTTEPPSGESVPSADTPVDSKEETCPC